MTTTETQTGKAPTHTAYQVREGKNDKNFWTRIGAAWQHKDGKGFSLQLDCVPLDGRVQVRINDDKQ
jgi:hypothetical protein